MQIYIYSTHTCPFCKREKAWLEENGIEYTNYFVDEDASKAEEMIEASGQMGVPFTRIIKDDGSEEHILGFQQEKLAEILGIE